MSGMKNFEHYFSADKKTPAHKYKDFFDYFPEKVFVLFSHQFASTVGVILLFGILPMMFHGWVEAIIWILISSIMTWGIQEIFVLYIAVENRGRIFREWLTDRVSRPFRAGFFLFVWFFVILLTALITSTLIDAFTIRNSSIYGIFPIDHTEATSQGATAMVVVLFLLCTIFFRFVAVNWNTVGKLVAGVLIVAFCFYAGRMNPLNITDHVWYAILFIFLFLSAITPIRNYAHARDFLLSIVVVIFIILILYNAITIPHGVKMLQVTPSVSDRSYLVNHINTILLAGIPFGAGSLISAEITSKRINSYSDIVKTGGASAFLGMMIAVLITFLALTGKMNMRLEMRMILSSILAIFLLTSADSCLRSISHLYMEVFQAERSGKKILQTRYAVVAVTACAGIILSILAERESLIVLFKISGQFISFLLLMISLLYFEKRSERNIYLLISTVFTFCLSSVLCIAYLIKAIVYIKDFVHNGFVFSSEILFYIGGCIMITAFFFLTLECIKIYISEISNRNNNIETTNNL